MTKKLTLPKHADVYHIKSRDLSVFSWENTEGLIRLPEAGDEVFIMGKYRTIEGVETYNKLRNPPIPAFGLAFKGDWREWDD